MLLGKLFALSNVLREDATIRFAISLLVCKFCPLLFMSYARGGGRGGHKIGRAGRTCSIEDVEDAAQRPDCL